MKKLRNAILRSFIVYFLGLSVAGGLIEEFFNQLEELVFGKSYQIPLSILSGTFQILAVIAFSFLFYRSLNKKIEEESQKLAKEQSTLFVNIAHDLKTPLTSITGFSKALNEEIVASKEINDVSGIIYQKAVTANELLDLMFQYTKLNSAEFSLNRQVSSVNYLLKEALAENYDLIEQQHLELLLDLPEEPVMKSIDKIEMRRVFNNLLINACKHNPPESTLAISFKEKMIRSKSRLQIMERRFRKKNERNFFSLSLVKMKRNELFKAAALGWQSLKRLLRNMVLRSNCLMMNAIRRNLSLPCKTLNRVFRRSDEILSF